MEKHRIAVTVFVEAEGVDRLDASHLAEDTVRFSLLRQMNENEQLSFTDRRGDTHFVQLIKIAEIGAATAGGYLRLEPTSKAYPRDDEPEVGQ